ncbi:hypothetical protein K492DRAFT_206710 [Lichtheimia hyalospora FSU 10163]|nr:hypothetical protein K492DRAFT_206710 [Lichtheimia hyalospora FSU 10163]
MVTIRKPVAKPTSSIDPATVRETELKQLERRYRSSFRIVSNTEGCSIVRYAIQPSDPDFPYELDSLLLQLKVPDDYPTKHCTLTVLSSIPKGFAFNIERGYENYVRQMKTTLVRQMNWLDRNLESLLQQEAAATVRFISSKPSASSSSSEPLIAPALPDEFIAAVSSPKPSQQDNTASSSSNITMPPTTAIKDTPPASSMNKLDARAIPFFTSAQLKMAAAKKDKELRQLETRFGSSYKVVRSDTVETVVSLMVNLTDPTFAFKDTLGNELKIKYHVPAQYPLLPSTIEVENKALSMDEARDISYTFAEHVESAKHTLFQNLNWLNRHLERILKNPRERPWKQDVTDTEAKHTETETFKKDFSGKVASNETSNVVIVNDPEALLPPGVTWDDIDQFTPPPQAITSDHDDDVTKPMVNQEDTQPDVEASSSSSAQPVEQQQQQPVIRKGTQVKLVEPRFENCTLIRVMSVQVDVLCGRCESLSTFDNLNLPDILSATGSSNETNDKYERWMQCSTCSSLLGAKFIPELMHENSNVAGLLQLGSCKVYDVTPKLYMGNCAKCMEDFPSAVRKLPKVFNCQTCHARISVNDGGVECVSVGPREGAGIRPSNATYQTMALKKKKKVDKERLIVGEPLPERGACSHYRKSRRWFRFGCCNKLYPCDVCHDVMEKDHTSELAQRHVCGQCSKEQAIKPICIKCGYEFERSHQKGSFWEGGEGVRNRKLMSRKDPHKHKGLSKTISKKQERVGSEGKKRRQQEPE